MASEWKQIPIIECIDLIGGGTPKTSVAEYWDGDIPWLSVKDFNNDYRHVYSTEKHITEAGLNNSSTKLLQKDDIIISARGTVGEMAMIPFPMAFNQSCYGIRAKDGINSTFLYYLLKNSISKLKLMTHGSVFDTITRDTFATLIVGIPDKKTQDAIAATLAAIDDKIELNNKINDNLEQQAQAFFQELFLDNADLEWKIGTISDLGAVVGGSTPSKAKPEYYAETGIAWITPKDLSINKSKFVSHGENDITELGLKNSSATIMPEGTVLFSSRAPIGYIAIAAGEVATNQGFKSIVPKPEIGTAFVYYFLKHNLPIIEGMASGSTFKEVSGSTMKGVPAVIPDTDTITRFNDFCAPIFAQQRILEEQNQSLAALRDSLLPKLMSGEIDVSTVQL